LLLFFGDVVAGYFWLREERAVFAEGAANRCLGLRLFGQRSGFLPVYVEDVVLFVTQQQLSFVLGLIGLESRLSPLLPICYNRLLLLFLCCAHWLEELLLVEGDELCETADHIYYIVITDHCGSWLRS
jgi:hypothetical protein